MTNRKRIPYLEAVQSYFVLPSPRVYKIYFYSHSFFIQHFTRQIEWILHY